jgi:hypothetical protein
MHIAMHIRMPECVYPTRKWLKAILFGDVCGACLVHPPPQSTPEWGPGVRDLDAPVACSCMEFMHPGGRG